MAHRHQRGVHAQTRERRGLVTSAHFDGFSADAVAFLAGLEADNSKDYFDAHRSVYQTEVAEPLEALVVEVTEPTRKRVPAPYPRDHPRESLLRLDSLHVTTHMPRPDESASAAFPAWIAQQQAAFAPVQRWLVEHLT